MNIYRPISGHCLCGVQNATGYEADSSVECRCIPSWQARLIGAIIRKFIREPLSRITDLGDAAVRKVRYLFGLPLLFQWLRTYGVRIQPVQEGMARGEWLEPKENPRDGAILYVHGGGYVACSPATHRSITAALARLTRLPVFSVYYRRAPEHPYPAALIDTIAAYGWLLRQLKKQDLDEKFLVLAGDSAGGGLVIGTLLCLRDARKKGMAACAVCFSPCTDLTARKSVHRNEGRCAMFHKEVIPLCAAAYLGGVPAFDAKYASPALLENLSGLPPILLQASSTELLLDDTVRVHEKISDERGDSTLEVFGDVPHCWQMFDGFMPEARNALRDATALSANMCYRQAIRQT
jgi:monoterpene epsilon-lactone hydrolase